MHLLQAWVGIGRVPSGNMQGGPGGSKSDSENSSSSEKVGTPDKGKT